jgi:methyltransferase family protein
MRRQVKGEAVRRELLPGTSTELLKELHLLTRAGDLNADSLRKLKQVNHLAGLLAPALDDVLGRFGDPVVVDCGAGKSYLGFVLYELFLAPAGKGRVLAVESRPELAHAGAERAARLGFDRLRFVEAPIAGAPVPERVHAVTALHACDTATDDALARAVSWQAPVVLAAPCCHHDVAAQLRTTPAPAPYSLLTRSGILRERFADTLTDAMRAAVLRMVGYRVDVIDFVDSKHTPRNTLLRAVRTGAAPGYDARAELDELTGAWGVHPKLAELLRDRLA